VLRQPLTWYKCQFKHEKPVWFLSPGSKDYSPQARFMKFLMEQRSRLVVGPFCALAEKARRPGESGHRAAIGQRVQRWDSGSDRLVPQAVRRTRKAVSVPLWHSSCTTIGQKQFNRNNEMNPALTSGADVVPPGTRRPRTDVRPELTPPGGSTCAGSERSVKKRGRRATP
jgi:hypothetical protein